MTQEWIWKEFLAAPAPGVSRFTCSCSSAPSPPPRAPDCGRSAWPLSDEKLFKRLKYFRCSFSDKRSKNKSLESEASAAGQAEKWEGLIWVYTDLTQQAPQRCCCCGDKHGYEEILLSPADNTPPWARPGPDPHADDRLDPATSLCERQMQKWREAWEAIKIKRLARTGCHRWALLFICKSNNSPWANGIRHLVFRDIKVVTW